MVAHPDKFTLRITDIGPADSQNRRLRFALKKMLRSLDLQCDAITHDKPDPKTKEPKQ